MYFIIRISHKSRMVVNNQVCNIYSQISCINQRGPGTGFHSELAMDEDIMILTQTAKTIEGVDR